MAFLRQMIPTCFSLLSDVAALLVLETKRYRTFLFCGFFDDDTHFFHPFSSFEFGYRASVCFDWTALQTASQSLQEQKKGARHVDWEEK